MSDALTNANRLYRELYEEVAHYDECRNTLLSLAMNDVAMFDILDDMVALLRERRLAITEVIERQVSAAIERDQNDRTDCGTD